MATFFLRLTLFLVLSTGLALALDTMLMHGLRERRTDTLGSWNRLVDGRINADILFTGSSRAMVHFDAPALSHSTALDCYNLGINGVQLRMQIPLLRTYLDHNRPPRWIIQSLDIHSLEFEEDLYDPSKYPPYLDEPHIYTAVTRVDPSWWKDRWIPLYSFSRFDHRYAWTAMEGLLGLEDTLNDPLKKGYNPRERSWDGSFDDFIERYPQGRNYSMTTPMLDSLQALIDLAKESGSMMALVYTPELKENQLITLNRTEIMETYARIARDNDIPFWDFSFLSVCDDRRYFYNSQHMNRSGTDRFTPALADSLNAVLARQ